MRSAATVALSGVLLARAVLAVPTATRTTDETVTTCGNYTGTAESPVVSVHYGCLQGNKSSYIDTVYNFKNIPFGSDTSGDNRWTHTPSPADWTELRDCTAYGPTCPQPGSDNYSEDCLQANIWVPVNASLNDSYENTTIRNGALPYPNATIYPVLLWFHGGRYGRGSGIEPQYDGAGLAAKGVVVVTVNYRLGALGWLATAELRDNSTESYSGNWALADQQAAMHWVQETIAIFGGDPDHITIGGEGAGAGSVLQHLASSGASGLFQQIIAVSGARYPSDPMLRSLAEGYRTVETAEEQGQAYLENVLKVSTVAEARNLSAEVFLSSADMSDPTAYAGTVFANSSAYAAPPLFRPELDGYVVAGNYSYILSSGAHETVPILTGTAADEAGASVSGPYASAAAYESSNELIFSSVGLADEYFSLFPAGSSAASANNASNEFFRDASRTGAHMWASEYTDGCGSGNETACAVYTYYWSHTPPASQHRGAYGGSEIQYAFNNLYATPELEWTDDDKAIADKMSDYWVNFISSADPNGAGLASWPVNDASYAQTMELGDTFSAVDVASSDDNVSFIKSWFGKWTAY